MVFCEIRVDRWIGGYDELLGFVGTGVTAAEYVSSRTWCWLLTRLASFTCVEIVRVGLCGTVDCYWNLGLNLWGIELGVEFVVAEELP